MRLSLNSRNWATGEIHPDLAGRTDLNKYQSGLKKLRNCFINKRGILYNTPGTQTVLPGKFPSKTTRSIPFKISFTQQLELLFGDQYMHVIQNDVPVFNMTARQITTFPNGSNPTITMAGGSAQSITSLNIANGMLAQMQPYNSGFSFLNNFPIFQMDFSLYCYNRWFIIQNVAIGVNTTTFTVTDLYGNNIDSTTWGTFGNNLQINTVYELPTPYAYTDLALLKHAQSFDVMQLRHASYISKELKYNNGSWSLNNKLSWPTQTQDANGLAASGGTTSPLNYYYKVTTRNLTTQLESLPCPILTTTSTYSQPVIQATLIARTLTVELLVASTTGLVSGSKIYLDNDYYYNMGSGGQVLYKNTGYTVQSISPTHIYITSAYYNQSSDSDILSSVGILNPTVYTKNGSSANQIASFSNTNPMIITTMAPHGLINGQEVNIQGTGVYGLDGLNFNVTVIGTISGSTTLQLNGVDSANYDLSGFVSSDTTLVSATTVIIPGVTPSVSNPITVGGLVTNASSYTSDIVFCIYASYNIAGPFGFVGYALPAKPTVNFSFIDMGIPPDTTLPPKSYTPLFLGVGNYPSACNFYQQRLVEFATNNNPQGLFASAVGDYNDFTDRNPIQENDAIIMNVWSNELQQIFDSADSGFLVLITDVGPMVAAGDTSGEFTPSTNLIKRYAFAGGAQQPRPLHIFKNIVYYEANQGCIRDLEVLVTPFYTYIDKSDDVSLFSEHLLAASRLVAWDYKQYPDSQICAVRADGIALLITYFNEQGIQAFSWMDTNGGNDRFTDVATIQEGNETYAYWTVDRDTGTWIERMASRYYTDPTVDALFTHASAVVDGRVNTGATAVLSGNYGFGQTFTATLSSNIGNYFTSGWVIAFKDANGNIARMKLVSTPGNSLVGTAMETFPSTMIGETISDIRVCTTVIGGLWHLEGQNVSVVADGFVVSDANDNSLPTATVTNGTITLQEPAGVINVGLPYYSDIQTLDLDEPKAGDTFVDKLMGVKAVTVKLLNTGDILVGPDFTENLPLGTKMEDRKFRDLEGYLKPTGLFTGILPIPIDNRYGYGGSFAIRNSKPLPFTLLSATPRVEVQS